MKTKEFSTTKGDFVLVDLPKYLGLMTWDRDGDFYLNGEALLWNVYYIGELKELTEEQAAEIADFALNDRYKEALVYALCDMGIHLYENPVEWPYYTITAYGVLPEGYKRFDSDKKEWHTVEENTFYNPILLKRI